MKIPFSPSVYEHAAALIGMTPWEVSRDTELLRRAHNTAYKLYGHTPIVVGIDIYNIEAEAYGCIVERPGGNGIPAITNGIFSSIKESLSIKPFNPKTDGRIMTIIGAGKKLATDFPDADVRIPVSGPFSIAVSLRSLTGILEDVAYMIIDGDRLEVETLFGERRILQGRVHQIDFLKSRVQLEKD